MSGVDAGAMDVAVGAESRAETVLAVDTGGTSEADSADMAAGGDGALDELARSPDGAVPADVSEVSDAAQAFDVFDSPPETSPRPMDAPAFDGPADAGDMRPTAELRTGLIGYWRMDEPAGSLMARDSSGLNHHGVLEYLDVSRAWALPGRFDGAVNIPAGDKNTGIRVALTSRITGITRYTIAAWARRTRLRPLAYQSIISRQLGQGIAEVFCMSVSLDRLNAYAPDRSSAGVTGAIASQEAPVNVWFHAAATFDGSTIRLYQDGALQMSVAWTTPLPMSSSPLYLGTNKNEAGLDDNHHPWEGQLDEVLLYDVALSAASIRALAQGERPAVP